MSIYELITDKGFKKPKAFVKGNDSIYTEDNEVEFRYKNVVYARMLVRPHQKLLRIIEPTLEQYKFEYNSVWAVVNRIAAVRLKFDKKYKHGRVYENKSIGTSQVE